MVLNYASTLLWTSVDNWFVAAVTLLQQFTTPVSRCAINIQTQLQHLAMISAKPMLSHMTVHAER